MERTIVWARGYNLPKCPPYGRGYDRFMIGGSAWSDDGARWCGDGAWGKESNGETVTSFGKSFGKVFVPRVYVCASVGGE